VAGRGLLVCRMTPQMLTLLVRLDSQGPVFLQAEAAGRRRSLPLLEVPDYAPDTLEQLLDACGRLASHHGQRLGPQTRRLGRSPRYRVGRLLRKGQRDSCPRSGRSGEMGLSASRSGVECQVRGNTLLYRRAAPGILSGRSAWS